jgi:DUF1680 family protein
VVDIQVTGTKPSPLTLRLRIPWWVQGQATLTINDKDEAVDAKPSTYVTLKRTWHADHLRLTLPKGLTAVPLPDRKEMVAYMDGPAVLAGLTDEARPLTGELIPDNEREWSSWLEGNYRAGTVRFIPIYKVTDQRYTLYFPVK